MPEWGEIKLRTKVLKLYGWVLAMGFLFFIIYAVLGIEIACFYRATTGFKCPGCGLTRMCMSMLRLDFVSAFLYNPICFVLFFVWNIVGLLCVWGRFEFVTKPRFLFVLMWCSFAVLLVYGFLRNFL